MKILSKYITIVILLISSSLMGQDNSIWIGENLTEIMFESGKWVYQSENWVHELKDVGSKYFIIDEINGEIRNEIGFEKLDVNLDTIKLLKGLSVNLFVKSELLIENNFKFHAFELDLLGQFGTVETKYHLNKYGLFRKSNLKNKTIIEKEVTAEKLSEFEKIIKKIDIKNMEKANGMRNNCDNKEYSFTFWDMNGKKYNFVSIRVRKQLMPIKEFMINLEK